jgi:hypothetical protein
MVISGHGDDVVTVDRTGLKIVTFERPNCTRNTILQTDGAESLLVNTVGNYRGQHWVDMRDGSMTTTYTVSATGNWTLTVGGLDMVQTFVDGPVTGSGDDVIIVDYVAEAAAITNKGSGNFVVWVVSFETSSIDLAVNQIGSYSGTVPFDSPAIIQVQSEGDLDDHSGGLSSDRQIDDL